MKLMRNCNAMLTPLVAEDRQVRQIKSQALNHKLILDSDQRRMTMKLMRNNNAMLTPSILVGDVVPESAWILPCGNGNSRAPVPIGLPADLENVCAAKEPTAMRAANEHAYWRAA